MVLRAGEIARALPWWNPKVGVMQARQFPRLAQCKFSVRVIAKSIGVDWGLTQAAFTDLVDEVFKTCDQAH